MEESATTHLELKYSLDPREEGVEARREAVTSHSQLLTKNASRIVGLDVSAIVNVLLILGIPGMEAFVDHETNEESAESDEANRCSYNEPEDEVVGQAGDGSFGGRERADGGDDVEGTDHDLAHCEGHCNVVNE